MKSLVYLGLGSNVGDRLQHLRQALLRLGKHSHMILRRISPIYETAPVGMVDQADFYNLVCEIDTTLEATELLSVILEIERQLHRVRTIRWGPRTIDIDLLLYKDQMIQQPDLVVPHPRMTERAFVMAPLATLIPQYIPPGTTQTVSQIYTLLDQEQAIRQLDMNLWHELSIDPVDGTSHIINTDRN